MAVTESNDIYAWGNLPETFVGSDFTQRVALTPTLIPNWFPKATGTRIPRIHGGAGAAGTTADKHVFVFAAADPPPIMTTNCSTVRPQHMPVALSLAQGGSGKLVISVRRPVDRRHRAIARCAHKATHIPRHAAQSHALAHARTHAWRPWRV